MIIQKIFAEEIFNAQGLPTLQCTIELENGQVIKSSIPAGFTSPKDATPYAYDKNNRIIQERMQDAIADINNIIVPMLIKQPLNVLSMDSALMDLAITAPHRTIGSNTTLAVSIALFKAQAAAEGSQLFQFIQSISGTEKIQIPKILVSLFECRTHQAPQEFKEILVIPNQTESFEAALHSAILLHHHAKNILEIKHLATTTGQYGSFSAPSLSINELFTLVDEIIQTIPQHTYQLGLNIQANDIFNLATNTYTWEQQALTSNALVEKYQTLIRQNPSITYLQDAIADKDTPGWKLLTEELQNHTTLAADSIFGANPMKIRWGILQKIANMVIIKPEYLGTISQTIAAIDACKYHKKLFCIAGDTMGTHDTFISDLACATGATGLKAGAPFGSEHMAKYNRLLEIERFLQI